MMRSTSAALRHSKWLSRGTALALLTLTACTPPATDDNDVEQAAVSNADEIAAEGVAGASVLEALLRRLGEPPLAQNCAEDTTSYRVARLDWEQGAAAVRVFWGPDGGGYRSVFSPALGEAISSDGWLDERMWNRVEREFRASDFWNIDSDEFADEYARGVMFLEACKDGVYHHLESDPRHHWLRHIVSLLSRIGKLEWLESGRMSR